MDVDVTTMSQNGQVVIPKGIRDRLGLRPGETFLASEVDGRIVLAPARSERIRQDFERAVRAFGRNLGAADFKETDAVDLVRQLRDRRRAR